MLMRMLPPSGASSQARADLRRELHPLLLLALVAEPHAHHVLLQVQLLGDRRDLAEKEEDFNYVLLKLYRDGLKRLKSFSGAGGESRNLRKVF